MDADLIATGHYARTRLKKDGKNELLKGLDETKDQSYYLALLNQETLKRTIFPLGESRKEEIIKVFQKEIGPEAKMIESQNLCFLSGHNYHDFLEKYAPESIQRGEIINTQGQHLGFHEGLAFYTIGQRKGIKISAKDAYYIVRKSRQDNRIIVGFKEELGKDIFQIKDMHWISEIPQKGEKQYAVKIRYRANPVLAKVKPSDDPTSFEIKLKRKLRDVTPGQYAVLYHRDAVVGAGEISYN